MLLCIIRRPARFEKKKEENGNEISKQIFNKNMIRSKYFQPMNKQVIKEVLN